MRLLYDLIGGELLSGEVDIDSSQSVPVVESLSFAAVVVHFGLEQLAAHQVVHDQRSRRALPARWVCGGPCRGVCRIAGFETPGCPDGGLKSLKSESITCLVGRTLHSSS